MLIPSEIANALDRIPDLREYDRFQELAFHLAHTKWPGLRLTHKVHDRSADALDTENCLALACGWNGDLSKLKDDCRGLKENRPYITKLVFATSLKVEETQVLAWQKSVKADFGLDLIEVIHRDWIVGELTRPEHRWLAHQYLQLPIDDFADLKTYLPRIKSAAALIISAWKINYPSGQNPVLDLRVVAGGVNSNGVLATELKVSNFPEKIRRGDLIWIAGQPGIGKTHSLISIAENLASSNRLIPVLISLRDWGLQGCRLLDHLAAEPAMLQQGISAQTLATALEAGHLTLLLNGWNEMPDEVRQRATADLVNLLSQFAGASVVGTSRSVPKLNLPRPHLDLRIDELNDAEIHHGLIAAQVPNVENVYREILSNSRISQLARVPLFLWELASAAQSNHSLPRTRFELLHRSVLRASKEHEEFLTIDGVPNLAPRFLSALARAMTECSLTVLAGSQARLIVADISKQLQSECFLSAPTSPPSVLKRLVDGHLLFEGDEPTSFRFSHQLFQEYFAALDLARTFTDFPAQSFRSWAWSVPIQLAIEELCRQERSPEAAKFVIRLASVDLEAASRAVGTNPTIWSHLQNEIRAMISNLVKIKNVNAQWLASRCAAATGQPEFADVVFGGLAGHPADSENCYVGLPVESVFASLGPTFVEQVLAHKEDAFRFRVLSELAENGTHDGLLLASQLAVSDQSQVVRERAFELLFAAGGKGWHRQFAREVCRQGGWSRKLLAIAHRCPEVTLLAWRRRIVRLLTSRTSASERVKLHNMWFNLDPAGVGGHSVSEYEWCRSAFPLETSGDNEPLRLYRRLCLRRAAHQAADWVALKVIEEIDQGEFVRLAELPLECLSQTQKDDIVAKHILTVIKLEQKRHERFAAIAPLSPKTAARSILRLVATGDFPPMSENWSWAVQIALRSLDRNEVLSVVCETCFDSPAPDELARLLDTLMRSRPDEKVILREEVLGCWQTRLHGWILRLPPMGQETAHLWPDAALLLGEIGHADDAGLVLSWLQMDHDRVIKRQEEWRTRYEAYRASGGKTAPPGPHDACSYQNIYHQALWGFAGDRVAAQIAKLIEIPHEMGFAANWLATHLGAPSAETLSQGRLFNNYELVSARRVRSAELTASASSTIAALKTAIDRCVSDEKLRTTDGIRGAFLALARLEGGPSGAWIVERLEKYYGDKTWESLFQAMTLVGASFEGKRLLPFARHTIHEVVHPQCFSSTDYSHRIVEALISLLYSDAPALAGELLDHEAAPVVKNKEFQIESLVRVSRWAVSPWIDDWIKTFFSLEKPERLRSTAFHVAIDRAADRQSFVELRTLASSFIRLGNLERSEGDWTIPRRLGEILSQYPDYQAAVVNDALAAKTIDEARRWLRLLGGFESDQSVLVAFQLAERFGESQLNVVTCISPSHQEGSSLFFTGWGAPWRRTSWQSPAILEQLAKMSQCSDDTLRIAAQNALFWLERERLTSN